MLTYITPSYHNVEGKLCFIPPELGMDLHVRRSCRGRCLSVAPEGMSVTFVTS
jgi:hypothetical protein